MRETISIPSAVKSSSRPQRDGRTEVVVCEVNARVTGATYPSLLARHFLPQRAWLMRNFAFAPRLTCAEALAALDDAGLLFTPGRDEGLLPINFIPITVHLVATRIAA